MVAANTELANPKTAESENSTSIPRVFQIYPPSKAIMTLIR
jgi:hypothetical protein